MYGVIAPIVVKVAFPVFRTGDRRSPRDERMDEIVRLGRTPEPHNLIHPCKKIAEALISGEDKALQGGATWATISKKIAEALISGEDKARASQTHLFMQGNWEAIRNREICPQKFPVRR